MFNNVEHWFKQLNKTLEQAKRIYEEFRLYSLGSYALNLLTPRQGYTVQSNIAYGLRARHRLDLYRTTTARSQRPLMVFVHGGACHVAISRIIVLWAKHLPKKALMLR